MYKWVLIASVQKRETIPQLLEFGRWLVKAIAARAHEFGTNINFEEKEMAHFYAEVDNAENVYEIYDTVHDEYPSVTFVLHILPRKDSNEYRWMKMMCDEMGLVRQGVLEENALNKFEGLDIEEVLGNITQWIGRELFKLSSGKIPQSDRPFRLALGDRQTSKVEKSLRFPKGAEAMQSFVTMIHGEPPEKPESLESSISITGLPIGLSPYVVAAIFEKLSVEQVSFDGPTAYVKFANKFHAFQAIRLFGKHVFDQHYPLKMQPMTEDLSQMIEKISI